MGGGFRHEHAVTLSLGDKGERDDIGEVVGTMSSTTNRDCSSQTSLLSSLQVLARNCKQKDDDKDDDSDDDHDDKLGDVSDAVDNNGNSHVGDDDVD